MLVAMLFSRSASLLTPVDHRPRRSSNRITCGDCHCPPRAVLMPRAFAIARVVCPVQGLRKKRPAYAITAAGHVDRSALARAGHRRLPAAGRTLATSSTSTARTVRAMRVMVGEVLHAAGVGVCLHEHVEGNLRKLMQVGAAGACASRGDAASRPARRSPLLSGFR